MVDYKLLELILSQKTKKMLEIRKSLTNKRQGTLVWSPERKMYDAVMQAIDVELRKRKYAKQDLSDR